MTWAGDTEKKRDVTVEDAFRTYLDACMDDMYEVGLEEVQAFEVLFRSATVLEGKGVLPPFPAETDYDGMANWLVKAHDAGFHEMLEDVLGKLSVEI